MKIRRSFTPVVWSSLAAILGCLVWWGTTPASAAFTATSSSLLVTVIGTVMGSPEAVDFSGQAQVASKVVTDPDFGGQANVVLTIDLSGVTGVGRQTGAKYGFKGQPLIEIRPLVSSDAVGGTVAFDKIGSMGMSSRLALMSSALNFDTTTRVLSGATISLATP